MRVEVDRPEHLQGELLEVPPNPGRAAQGREGQFEESHLAGLAHAEPLDGRLEGGQFRREVGKRVVAGIVASRPPQDAGGARFMALARGRRR